MSKTTKKKYVVDEVLNNYEAPSKEQQIVKVLSGRGNNLHEVKTSDGNVFLASMPPKFRKNIWIKRGDFVVIDPIAEGVKVKGEIVQILLKEQIKYFKSLGIWPKEFSDNSNSVKQNVDSDNELFVNRNRVYVDMYVSSDEISSEEEKEEET